MDVSFNGSSVRLCIVALLYGTILVSGCSSNEVYSSESVAIADTLTHAQTEEGAYISWKEHIIDGEDVNGGLKIRGGDGVKIADLNKDGKIDIVSVHEDSNHLRVAFGGAKINTWDHITLASGSVVAAIEDVAIGDLNNDGWLDIVVACEEGHLLYLENPGAKMRTVSWAQLIPDITKNRGSWLRVSLVDIDGDGQLDILGSNKGGVDIVDVESGEPKYGSLSILKILGNPLEQKAWQEERLWEQGVPNSAIGFDVDGDNDIDILSGSRLKYETLLFLNEPELSTQKWATHEVEMMLENSGARHGDWTGRSNVFYAAHEDLDADKREDIILTVIEEGEGAPILSLGWLQNPGLVQKPWAFFRIGDIMPDVIVGFSFADIDNDGDLDVIAGGYSGLNVVDGGYSGHAREYDAPEVTSSSSVGRISWFENPGDARLDWQRHDISRRVRGMYDEFAAHDMDGDGDIDFVATRGNSGTYDGVFWLEQIRSETPQPAFSSARVKDSLQLPLPPLNWRELYQHRKTTTAPKNE